MNIGICPGGSRVVRLRCQADHKERVDKTIRIYGNVEEDVLVVRLTGRAE